MANYKNRRTGKIIHQETYDLLTDSQRSIYSEVNSAGEFIDSAIIGRLTNSAIAGGLLGGSITGGIVGDILDGDLFD